MRIIYLLSLSIIVFLSSFTIDKFKKVSLKKVKGKYTYIPSGTLQHKDKVVSINPFYMMTTEVTNLDYREFLAHLEKEGRFDDLQIAQVNASGDVFYDTYKSHSSYDDYPVLNISKAAARLYCNFLSETLSKNNVLGKDVKKVKVRLPLDTEWVHAAKGGREAPYPWGGYYLKNAKGCYLANFKRIGEGNITKNSKTGHFEIVDQDAVVPNLPASTRSYFPNDFGLYNMSGNAAEMVENEEIAMGGSWNSGGFDVKTTSFMNFDEPSTEVGFRPVFTVEFY